MTELYDVITTNNQGGAFPNTRGINSSGPLATDGTEYNKDVLDDIWATKQAELDFYDQTPNGLPNDNGIDGNFAPVSQPLAQQYLNFQTPGGVIPIFWNPTLDPVILGGTLGFDIRILILQGQGIDRTLLDFQMLDSLVYVGDAANPTADSFFRADDAGGVTRNIAGQFLILADMRGQFLRGYDPGALVDPDGASRIPGNIQTDALQNITGSFDIRELQPGNSNAIIGTAGVLSKTDSAAVSAARFAISAAAGVNGDRINFDASDSVLPNVAKTDDIETRSTNLIVRWGIYF